MDTKTNTQLVVIDVEDLPLSILNESSACKECCKKACGDKKCTLTPPAPGDCLTFGTSCPSMVWCGNQLIEITNGISVISTIELDDGVLVPVIDYVYFQNRKEVLTFSGDNRQIFIEKTVCDTETNDIIFRVAADGEERIVTTQILNTSIPCNHCDKHKK